MKECLHQIDDRKFLIIYTVHFSDNKSLKIKTYTFNSVIKQMKQHLNLKLLLKCNELLVLFKYQIIGS